MPPEHDAHIEEPEQSPEKSNGEVPRLDREAAARDLELWSERHGAVLVAFNPRAKDVNGKEVVLPARIRIEPKE